MNKIDVLDHGYVRLVDAMGDDLRVVNAAQASLDRWSTEFGSREAGILATLMREEHGVPFEHVTLTYQLRLPMFLVPQFLKHRVGSSWSQHSGRYSEMESLFYVPDEVRVQVGRAMSYEYEPLDPERNELVRDAMKSNSEEALATYHKMLDLGVAREHARLVLPQNLYTTAVWTLNLRALFNFLHLRNDKHAQGEAQAYAQAMESLAFSIAPYAVGEFIKNERIAP